MEITFDVTAVAGAEKLAGVLKLLGVLFVCVMAWKYRLEFVFNQKEDSE
jgi:hypothetical protein